MVKVIGEVQYLSLRVLSTSREGMLSPLSLTRKGLAIASEQISQNKYSFVPLLAFPFLSVLASGCAEFYNRGAICQLAGDLTLQVTLSG